MKLEDQKDIGKDKPNPMKEPGREIKLPAQPPNEFPIKKPVEVPPKPAIPNPKKRTIA